MADERQWTAVDTYFDTHLVGPDDVLERTQRANEQAGLPAISVAASHGKLLNLLARTAGARRVLEIGTLGGYSTIWLARALPPGGRVVTIEAEPRHAEVARANFDRAGLSDAIDIRVGAAREVLPELDAEGPFDFAFIDADKANNPHYFRRALELSRSGGLIVVDNVVRHGAVADPADTDPAVRGTRELIEVMAAEPRADATAVQTVGVKGYDGFAVALVTG